MDKEEARQILSHAFKDAPNKTSLNFSRKTKYERLDVIRHAESSLQDKHICAAIEITRTWRGYNCRKTLKKLFAKIDKHVKVSKVVINRPVSPASSIISRRSSHSPQPSDAAKLSTVSSPTKIIKTKPKEKSKPQRKNVSSSFSSNKENSKQININFSKHDAASVIQRAWRRHIDTQVFRYYQALINFHGQGDPAVMLRCINPLEAKLLDSAAGIHIKFRLAGEKFPPNIYYKIFTHRPIVDMCANSPKDYTKASSKQPMGKQVHTKHLPLNNEPDKQQWYHRFENNGWRLVSDRLIHAAMDPTTWETSQKKVEFHYNKPTRKADLEKRRRQKKIRWMQKMYQQGMIKAKQADEETNDLVERAAKGLTSTIAEQGEDAVLDWEIDELLQWTTALNFDDYLESWKESATSGISEAGIPLSHNQANYPSTHADVMPLPFDPYALTRTSSEQPNLRIDSQNQLQPTPQNQTMVI